LIVGTVLKVGLGVVLGFVVLIVGCGALIAGVSPEVQKGVEESSGGGSDGSSSDTPKGTSGQENALESAESYLEMGGMSKKGLIRQLSSPAGEDFSKADAKWAANHVDADWKAEAVESAESYLEMGGMSKKGLIEQLSSSAGEGFTPAQARYAANKVY
jgi:hypothetical protein